MGNQQPSPEQGKAQRLSRKGVESKRLTLEVVNILNINNKLKGGDKMLVPNQKIPVKWWVSNKEHFMSRGYKFTQYKDVFWVNSDDLSVYSEAKVKVVCDFCGNVFEKIYKNYVKQHDENTGDCCKQCKMLKSTATNIKRFGVPYPTQNSEVIKKTRNTFQNKYGVDWISKSKEWHDTVQNTCFNKYGVSNPFQQDGVKEKIKQSNLQKYGAENAMQNSEEAHRRRIKAMETMCSNGNVPVSKMEQQVCDMLIDIYGVNQCHQSVPIDGIVADCIVDVNGQKIDVEYDGWYWHKNREQQDRRRNNFLINEGYKVLRIKSTFQLPTQLQIIEAVDYLTTTNHNYKEIILDI